MSDRFEDTRGVIQDLIIAPLDSVTQIFTRRGHVRGNHKHPRTTQWTYVISGELLVLQVDDDGPHQASYGPGDVIVDQPGVAHAWRALEDCTVLVFTQGPRSGSSYEEDTVRLEVPLLPPSVP